MEKAGRDATGGVFGLVLGELVACAPRRVRVPPLGIL